MGSDFETMFNDDSQIAKNEEKIVFVDHSLSDTTPPQKVDNLVPKNLFHRLITIKDEYGRYMSDQEKMLFSLPSGFLPFFKDQNTLKNLENIFGRLGELKLIDIEEKKKNENEQKKLDESIIESMWNVLADQNTGKVYEKKEDRNTPLHMAAKDGNEALVQLLIEKSQLVNSSPKMWKNTDDVTPLHIAVKGGHFNITKLLLDNVPVLKKAWSSYFEDSPLHLATRAGHIDLIELLITEIPGLGDPGIENEDGLTAFKAHR